jgi:hypothetical protein
MSSSLDRLGCVSIFAGRAFDLNDALLVSRDVGCIGEKDEGSGCWID